MLTFTDGYLGLIPGFVVLLPAIAAAAWILRKGANQRWTLLALLALIHVTAVVALTIFPIPISGQDYYRHTRGMGEDNIVPFATIVWQLQNLTWNTLRQLSGNVLLLTPLGVYGPELWPRLRDWRRFLLVALTIGLSIEVAQYAGSLMEGFTYRVTDIDDAIMNATGALAAFAVWRQFQGSRFAASLAARVADSTYVARDSD